MPSETTMAAPCLRALCVRETVEIGHDGTRRCRPSHGNRITGYGLEDSRPGYDAVIQAESGFQYMNGPPGNFPEASPTKMPVALMDLLAAHQLKQACARNKFY